MDEDTGASEGLESFDSTQENLCEECGTENVPVVFIRNAGLRMQVCHSCRDKLAKERQGESKSFLGYFNPEHRSLLYQIGVTGADSPQSIISRLLNEIKTLRQKISELEVNSKPAKQEEVTNASHK